MRFKLTVSVWNAACLLLIGLVASNAWAQSVCLPAPRLLTTQPMGGQVGTEFDVVISGEHLEDVQALVFSHPGITAVPKAAAAGKPLASQYVVRIDPLTPAGVYEARLMTGLGISSARAFSVGSLPESSVSTTNTTLETAFPLATDSICNAAATARAVDYFSFSGKAGQRLLIECCAAGIDSKLKPVLIVADESGRDLVVQRGGDVIDFQVPENGTYLIKIHDLTFQGGASHFYRLALQELAPEAPVSRLPATRAVSSFSWPPHGLANAAVSVESEPNNRAAEAQEITLPCDLAGKFFPAADADTFQFMAKQGEVWWVEVASERLGLPTDPSVLVQHVAIDDSGQETLTDVVEMGDIASPVKPSSNQYAYDGPPYDGGSPDILAKLEIKQDGLHRLTLRDLFGGTRSDPRNEYRLVIRPAAPDFALVAWALHMELRNGDRNGALKADGAATGTDDGLGSRCGSQGRIQRGDRDLNDRVARGRHGQRFEDSGWPDAWGDAGFRCRRCRPQLVQRDVCRAREIHGEEVTRSCRLASMAWPVNDHWQEIPHARLLGDVPVSVGVQEAAPLTISAATPQWEAHVGEKLSIPLRVDAPL